MYLFYIQNTQCKQPDGLFRIYVPSLCQNAYVTCEMYLFFLYRLHHANSQVGYSNICAEFICQNVYVTCEMYLLSYTDYIMQTARKAI
jgi:hypothetical protein